MFVFSYVENCLKKKKKEFLQFQLRGVVGGISRVVGNLEFL